MHPSNLEVLPPNTTIEDFNKRIENAPGLVVADFFATWCPPCQRLVGELPNIANENQNVTFIKVNVEENNAISTAYKVTSIPHIAFLKNNNGNPQLLDTVVGFNLPKIKHNIQQFK